MTVDPFAAAQVNSSANGTAVADRVSADPFTGAHDSADPFATGSDYRGDFTPSPTLEAIQGRLICMIPRKYDGSARDPFAVEPGKTREQYTVDLYVLDGGRLTYYYTQKGNPEATAPEDRQDQVKEWVVDEVTPDQPFISLGYWVAQGSVIGKLKRSHRDGRPFLGVPIIGPTKADRDKGKTAAQVKAEVDAWISRGRAGARPRYSWMMADPSPSQRQAAITWWGRNRGDISPINTAEAPKGNGTN